MVSPKSNAQHTEKGKGKATTLTKGNIAFASPPQKWNQGEGPSSSQAEGLQAVAAMESSRPRLRGEREYELKSIPLLAKKWYKNCSLVHIHSDVVVEEHWLWSKHPEI